VRPSDTCARFGGDEFGLLLENVTEPSEVYDACRRMLDVIRRPVRFEDRDIVVDASMGIVFSTGGESADELIRNADLAMYRAKGCGKGRFQLFEAGMHEAIRQRIDLKADLERGIAAREFVAHYQPIVQLETAQVVGVEALVRWQHPTRGLLPPSELMDLAEETGLVVPIGRQVLTQACRHAAGWRSRLGDPLSINVNLSAPELQDPDLHDVLAGILAEHGVDPCRLVIEITESMLMVDTVTAAATLERLKRLGVRVALDDFGTGYSSLTYLRQLPVDVVKIDRSFVESLGAGGRESPLAGAVLALGRSLALDVTAEGVESRTQLDRLRELGCDQGQGYYFSRPLAARDVLAFLGAAPVDAVVVEI
jgi:predicted signal transduction protein with EAL and GGDEF domain